MIKTVGEVGTAIQTIGHEGFADCNLFIQRLDALYKVGEIKVVEKGGIKFCVVEARGLDEGCGS